jgi:hypothetical protein
MTGTRHKKSAMRMIKNGIHNGTWNSATRNYVLIKKIMLMCKHDYYTNLT